MSWVSEVLYVIWLDPFSKRLKKHWTYQESSSYNLEEFLGELIFRLYYNSIKLVPMELKPEAFNSLSKLWKTNPLINWYMRLKIYIKDKTFGRLHSQPKFYVEFAHMKFKVHLLKHIFDFMTYGEGWLAILNILWLILNNLLLLLYFLVICHCLPFTP